MEQYSEGTVYADGEAKCGATACIAGWGLALTYGRFNQEHPDYIGRGIADGEPYYWADNGEPIEWLAEGRKVFDLNHAEARALFHWDNWTPRHRHLAAAEGDGKAMIQLLDDLLLGVVFFDEFGDLIDTLDPDYKGADDEYEVEDE